MPLGINDSEIPEDCLLKHESDLYYEHEIHKAITSRQRYHKCLYCNKTFLTEKYLDRHLDNRHMDELHPDNHHCLSELAPMLGIRPRGKTQKGSKTMTSFSSTALATTCTPTTLEKWSYRCMSIARR